MIQTAMKLPNRMTSIINVFLLWKYSPPWPPCRLSTTSREYLLLCCGVSRVAGQNAICTVLFRYTLKGTVHTNYVTKQCSKPERIWRQNVLLKQKVMFISQTSLKLAPAWPEVPKWYFRLRARDHIVGTSKLFWSIYRLDIYIVSTYVYTRTLHECLLAPAALRAAALARSLLKQNKRQNALLDILKEW